MKGVSKLLVVLLVLGLAISAVAAGAKSIELRNDANLNGTKLAAGSYKVNVEGTGDAVKVTFLQKDKVIATANGKMVDGTAPEFSAVVINTKSNNSILELQLAGMKSKIVFNQ
jgi:uncharacterized lipoprotein YehR (DUF1307 family)